MGVRKWLVIFVIAIAVAILVNLLREEETIHDGFCITTEAKEVQEEMYKEEEKKHEHSFIKTVWEEATCEKSGYYTKVCEECGWEENVQEAPLMHEIQEIMVQKGNCMEDTIIRQECKYCKQQIGEEIRYTEVDVHELLEETVNGVIVTYCGRCGVVF